MVVAEAAIGRDWMAEQNAKMHRMTKEKRVASDSVESDQKLEGADKVGRLRYLHYPSEASDDLVQRLLGLSDEEAVQHGLETKSKSEGDG